MTVARNLMKMPKNVPWARYKVVCPKCKHEGSVAHNWWAQFIRCQSCGFRFCPSKVMKTKEDTP